MRTCDDQILAEPDVIGFVVFDLFDLLAAILRIFQFAHMFQIHSFAINGKREIRQIAIGMRNQSGGCVQLLRPKIFQEFIEDNLRSGIENRPIEGYILV